MPRARARRHVAERLRLLGRRRRRGRGRGRGRGRRRWRVLAHDLLRPLRDVIGRRRVLEGQEERCVAAVLAGHDFRGVDREHPELLLVLSRFPSTLAVLRRRPGLPNGRHGKPEQPTRALGGLEGRRPAETCRGSSRSPRPRRPGHRRVVEMDGGRVGDGLHGPGGR